MIDLPEGGMSIAGFFILLAVSILVRFLGTRLAPVLMPQGRSLAIATGWAGGFLASLLDNVFWHLGPQVAGISLAMAFTGCALSVTILGLFPFIRIWLGKV